jgi:Ca2+-binding EF-hand superfamily protein
MRPKATSSLGVGLTLLRFVGKAKRGRTSGSTPAPEPEPELEPEPEPRETSMAGSLAALRFMGKARRKLAVAVDARQKAAAELRAAGKAAVVTVDQQIAIAQEQLEEVSTMLDIHHIYAALKSARSLAQRYHVETLSEQADRAELELRERDEEVAKKLEARSSEVLLTEIRRLWDLMRSAIPGQDKHDGVSKESYTMLHILIDKSVSGEDWSQAAARQTAHDDWVDDVVRFSSDAGITAWFTKVKGVVQRKSEPIVAKHGWQTAFEQFDADGGGTLDLPEFRAAMRKFGVTEDDADDEDLDGLFTRADSDGSGQLDGQEFGEWLAGLEQKREHYAALGLQLDKTTRFSLETIDNVRDKFINQISDLGWSKLFQQFDTDGSGELDEDEFISALREDCGVSAQEVGDPELREVFNIIDEDGGGTLSAEEFVTALRTKQLETDNYRMTFEAFAMSLLEFVDYWATETSEAAYLQLLRGIFQHISKYVGDKCENRWEQPICDDMTGRPNYVLKDPDKVRRLVANGKIKKTRLPLAQQKKKAVRKTVFNAPQAALGNTHRRTARDVKRGDPAGRQAHHAMHRPTSLSLSGLDDKQASPPTQRAHNGQLVVRYSGAARRAWFFRDVALAAHVKYEKTYGSEPLIGNEAIFLYSRAAEAFAEALLAKPQNSGRATNEVSTEAGGEAPPSVDKQQQYAMEVALVDAIQAICYLRHQIDTACTCEQPDCSACGYRRQHPGRGTSRTTKPSRASTTQSGSGSWHAPFSRQGQQAAWRIVPISGQQATSQPIDSDFATTPLKPKPMVVSSDPFATAQLAGKERPLSSRSYHIATPMSPRPPAPARPASARTHQQHRKINNSRRSINARSRATAHIEDRGVYTVPGTRAAFNGTSMLPTNLNPTGRDVVPFGQTVPVVRVGKPSWLGQNEDTHGWTPQKMLAESSPAHFHWIQADAAERIAELQA